MSETRSFYYPRPIQPEEVISIEGGDFHHLRDVLRLDVDDPIELVTYTGRYNATILQMRKNSAEILVRSVVQKKESPCRYILWQSMIKPSKMDEVMDIATEMGVSEIVPLITERSTLPPRQPMEVESRTKRWQRIIVSAAKQAKRDYVPSVSSPISLERALHSSSEEDEIRIFFWECAENKDITVYLHSKQASRKVILLIGPEGGFSQEEASRIIQSGFVPASFGPTILRAEYAGLFALGLVRYLLYLAS